MAVIKPEEEVDSLAVPIVAKSTMPTGTSLPLIPSSSFIWLETFDGVVHEVERDVTMLCPLLHREVVQNSQGINKRSAIVLPSQVGPSILKLILEYCRFHQVPGRSDKERKMFDEKFIRLDTRRLCELASAAKSLDMNPLVDLACRALARMIEGMTPEEMRETFHLPDDLTEEEKLEPVKITTDDPRIRLLNQLYARKRRALQEKKRRKDEGASAGQSSAADDGHRDERSVDDLLSFIDGSGRDGKGNRRGKSKKKRNRRKKEQAKDPNVVEIPENRTQSTHSASDTRQSAHDSREGQGAKVIGETEIATDGGLGYDSAEFDDDEDDGLDPEMKEKLDREVEDFARRLNSGWPDRIQEILALASSSQERTRNIAPLSSKLATGRECDSYCREPVNSRDEFPQEVTVHNGGSEESQRRNPPEAESSQCKFRLSEALSEK
ncbi:S-phase kinase-associated protein 1 [Marchantia polymorpha subsp. ruderalis]|nr:hypothetical protein MARPO_0006s0066 [Marchantia polymorpha]BBN04591.1 hypothetical protein Mp_3g05960 [Marchantia polymorpha subsp. ruderalis]|eukprot:PTQ48027.1 hypothetical protein MARPO_0006s0066 [Marchantia polymorpha]